MGILALETAGGVRAALEPELLRAEAARVWRLYAAGVIREVYSRADRRDVVPALECESVAAAHERFASLPLVASGAIRFELIPLVPYDGFARLFAEQGGAPFPPAQQ